MTSNSTDWTAFTIDFSDVSPSANISNIVMLLDPSTDTEDIIYFDNITLSYDPGTGIGGNDEIEQLSLYPVPFSDELRVNSGVAIAQLSITNMMGQVVFNQNGLNTFNFNVNTAELAQGAYMVTVVDLNGERLSKQVLK